MNSTSPTLLGRLKQPGEQVAWSRFVQLYSPLFYFWAQRFGLQGQDAADLVQEVLVTLVQKLPEFQYDPQRGFRNWLRTLTHNKSRDFFRRRGALPAAAGAGDLADIPARAEPDPFDEVEYRRHVVSRALHLMQTEFPEK